MTPLVRGVIAASTAAGSMQKKSGSMSTKTGMAPVSATELAVAAKVNDGTMTSSPTPHPRRGNDVKGEVPGLTAGDGSTCSRSRNSDSNAATSGPMPGA
jgi:hypothetical protein